MEQGTIIFLAILFLAIAIPVIISNSKKKKKEKILLDRMNELAQRSNAKISTYQRWKDLQIGIDQHTGKLFFIRNTPDHEYTKELDLSQVKSIKVLKAERIVNVPGDKYLAVDRIDLTFYLKTPGSEVVLNFYNSAFDSPTIQGELQLAEKWKEIADSCLSEKK